MLVPDTSEHLFNIEVVPEVAVTTKNWHLRGTADIAHTSADLFAVDQRQWHTVVRVKPMRLHILPDCGAESYVETLDFDGQS